MSAEKIQKAFAEAVEGQINNDRHHGWGADDSKAVIEAVVMEDVVLFRENKENKDRVYGPSADAMKFIGLVVNPSAFRQILEKEINPLTKLSVLHPSEKKRAERAALGLYSSK